MTLTLECPNCEGHSKYCEDCGGIECESSLVMCWRCSGIR
jgi:hypothetical protein